MEALVAQKIDRLIWAATTADWVSETRKEVFGDSIQIEDAPSPSHTEQRDFARTGTESNEPVARSKGCTEPTDKDDWSEADILDPDFLQVLEDVLLGHPSNDTRQSVFSFRHHSKQVSPLSKLGYSLNNLILSIHRSFEASADLIDNYYHDRSIEEEQNRMMLKDVLQERIHYPSVDTEAKEFKGLFSTLLQASTRFRSTPKRQRNSLVIEGFLQQGSLSVADFRSAIRGLTSLSITEINSADSVLAKSRLLFSTGLLALLRSRFDCNDARYKNYVEIAVEYFLLDLAYGIDRCESWYHLGQSFDVLAQHSGTARELSAKAIRCYLLAIASYQRTEFRHDTTVLHSTLYHDLGVSMCYSKFLLQPGGRLCDTYKIATSLFKKAIRVLETEAASHFMLAVSTCQLFESYSSHLAPSASELSDCLNSAIASYRRALTLPVDLGALNDWGSRYNLCEEITSLFTWLSIKATETLADTQEMANQTLSILLEKRDEIGRKIGYLHHLPSVEGSIDRGPDAARQLYTKTTAMNLWAPPPQRALPKINHPKIFPPKVSPPDTETSWDAGPKTSRVSVDALPSSGTAPNNTATLQSADEQTKKSKRTGKEFEMDDLNGPRLSVKTRPKSSNVSRTQAQPLSDLLPEEAIARGVSLEKQQKITESMECFNHAVRPPNDHSKKETWWLKVAPLFEDAGKSELAMRLYKMVLDRDSENTQALQQLGRLYHETDESNDNQDRAIGYLERAVVFDKTNSRTWYQLGLAYITRGHHFKAHEALRHAIHRQREFVDCWLSLGSLNVTMKRYGEAQEAYDTAIELDQKKVDAWIQLGTLMQQVGKYSKAFNSFQKATSLEPTNMTAQRHLMDLLAVMEPH